MTHVGTVLDNLRREIPGRAMFATGKSEAILNVQFTAPPQMTGVLRTLHQPRTPA